MVSAGSGSVNARSGWEAYLVVTVGSVLFQRWLTDSEEEGLTTCHAHDILGSFVDFELRFGFSSCRLCVSVTFLLSSCGKRYRSVRKNVALESLGYSLGAVTHVEEVQV